MRPDIADLLSSWNRTLPGHPDRWMLGPSGKRLWMDYLDPLPGFSGRADFIHKMNLPLLFSVRCVGYAETALHPIRVQWQMNEGRVESENAAFSFWERKLITWEDQALSYQIWENKTDRPLTLELILPEGASLDKPFFFPCALHGVTPVMVLRSSIPWEGKRITLQPGEKQAILLAAAVGTQDEEEEMAASLAFLFEQKNPQVLMDEKARAYLRWFENVPDFDCGDPFMVKCWYYRFYILRKNLSEPGLGRLPGRCFYEGRSHRMPKTPYQASGWEFSRLIPLSVPLHVTDARWMKDGTAAKDALRALSRCLDENGIFAVASVDEVRKEYAHYAAWALYQYDLLHPDDAFIREVLPTYKTDARTVYDRTRRGDSLQIERTHALTGKEYQPSFWFFTLDRFPRSVRPAKKGYTPLKRVDRSVYTYLNFVGLSRLCERVEDADGAWFASEAEKIKRDILGKMWDPVSRCFYDLHWETDEKAFVKNIVAFDPLWAGITGEEHLPALEYLISPLYFALGSGFASTAADCPVFSADGGWRGDYFKGPHGCMWNGPSWPYTTGIALDALAKQSKRYGHAYDEAFEKYLKEYTLEHFPDDSAMPCLVEFYDSKTGEPLSEEPDYNHSFYADLIVRHLAGIEPAEQGVSFHPLKTKTAYFSLTGLYIQGHRIDVYYQKTAADKYSDLPDGYTVCVDGRRRFQGYTLETAMLIVYENQNGSTETR